MPQNALRTDPAEDLNPLTSEHVHKALKKPIELASSEGGDRSLHFVPESNAFILRLQGCPVAIFTGYSVEEVVHEYNGT